MKITHPFLYVENIIPPRCRNPRAKQFLGSIELEVPEVTSAEAPVALIQKSSGRRLYPRVVYRWWDNRLWVEYGKPVKRSRTTEKTQSVKQFLASIPKKEVPSQWFKTYDNDRAANEHRLRVWASRILFIDGKRWVECQEPRYVVQTFGLGHNHGGTATFVDWYYNPNISRDRYFRVDHFEEMIAYAQKVAKRRGDTNDLPRLRRYAIKFEILIPEVLRLNPREEHGEGDPFINSIERVASAAPNAEVAELGALLLLGQTLSQSR